MRQRVEQLRDPDYDVPDHLLRYLAYDRPTDRFDLEFGYRYVPGAIAVFAQVIDGFPFRCGRVEVNELGNTDRVDAVYADAEVRILVFGDSFARGSLANDFETVPYLLDVRTPGVVFKNFGVGGFGTGQELLLYREVRPDYPAHDVLLIYTMNDALDNVSTRGGRAPNRVLLALPCSVGHLPIHEDLHRRRR